VAQRIELGAMKPMMGTDACCARAANGHADAAPPSRVMNSRRFNRWKCIRSLTGQEHIA
jgi:hypothetical protein